MKQLSRLAMMSSRTSKKISFWGAGNNGYGQLAINNSSIFPTTFTEPRITVQDPYPGVTQPDIWQVFSMRMNSTSAVKSDGTLWTCGENSYGQLGHNDQSNRNKYTKILCETQVGSGVYKSDWITTGVGTEHISALDAQGNIWSAGRNDIAGVIGNGATTGNVLKFYNTSLTGAPFRESPIVFKDMKAGHRFVMGMDTNNDIWTWGNNGSRQLGRAQPMGIVDTITVTNGGTGYTLATTTVTISAPTGVNQVQAIGTPVISGGVITSISITKCGSGYVDGSTPTINITSSGGGTGATATATRGPGVANATQDNFHRKIDVAGPWVKMFAGGYHAGAIHSNGDLYTWGLYSSGQRGQGVVAQNPAVIPTIGGVPWVDAYMGENSTFLRDANGSLYATGVNTNGELGIGTNTNTSTLTLLSGAWRAVQIDWWHAMGIKTDGTLWAWGTNTQGQLGRGNNTASNVPVQIGTDTNWTGVLTGIYASMAYKLVAA